MKLTRFAQSCILVESKGKRILIDPGDLEYHDKLLEEWKCDAIFVTHKHSDHFHINAIKQLLTKYNCKFYSSREVAASSTELKPEIVKAGNIVKVGEIKVEVVKSVHGYVPFLKGDLEIKEGLGFIIDDSRKRAYFVGDSLCFENDFKCNVLFVPVNNHGLAMGPFEAALFAKETGADLVIPYHYENPRFPADLDKIKEEFEKQDLNYKFLRIKETIEV
ncbi:MAG: MBL fold metallo-hydrolase [Candidatus ainarchaeum sp.]|nr:MBL fold metallo-hydrolase [Candidatus ainarchaeum sp.]